MASTPEDLFAAIDAGDADRVRAVLAADPQLATARDERGVSVLMRARYRPEKDLTQAVLAHAGGLDVFEAASFGELDRLTDLLEHDRSLVEARSGDGFTPLHLAAFFDGPDVASILVARGADVDAYGSGWMRGTPLHSAASADRIDVATILLEAGADLNARQSGGWTPLHAAAKNGSTGLVRLLLAAGADPTATNDEGVSALDLAHGSGEAAVVAMIVQAVAEA